MAVALDFILILIPYFQEVHKGEGEQVIAPVTY